MSQHDIASNPLNQPLAQIQAAEGQAEPDFLVVGEASSARRVAYLRRSARGAGAARPGIFWFGGFRSDMNGRKAARLDRAAAEGGRAFLRFDYSGHGRSEGRFETATVGMWLEESLAVLRNLSNGPQVFVGSSMGGWLALLAARAFYASGEAARLKALVLVSPAVDFTEKLLWEAMPPQARAELDANGVWLRASAYAAKPYPIAKTLIEEGRRHLLFEAPIRSYCPVHILQGMRDEDVPWRQAVKLVEHLPADPVSLTLVKDGDHRLSREEDLARLWAGVEAMG